MWKRLSGPGATGGGDAFGQRPGRRGGRRGPWQRGGGGCRRRAGGGELVLLFIGREGAGGRRARRPAPRGGYQRRASRRARGGRRYGGDPLGILGIPWMPLGASAPNLAVGLLLGLFLSWWGGTPPPPTSAPALAQQAGFVAPACPAPSGWAPLAAAGAFLLGLGVASCLALGGVCAVAGAGFIWTRGGREGPRPRPAPFGVGAAALPRARPLVLQDIGIHGEPTLWR